MKTEVLEIDPQRPDHGKLAYAGQLIREGKLVAFPTETVYGLGADALNEFAVQRIFAAKDRALSDPIIVHIAAPDDIERVAAEVPEVARVLARTFWPGPLTLVLPKRPEIPLTVTAGRQSVGVRMPSHPVARGLIEAAGVPIAAPSANKFMRTTATLPEHVLDDLGGRIELLLAGGPAISGIESTVIAVTEDEIRLLRPGATPREAIAAAVEPHGYVVRAGLVQASESPGLLEKHYAPNARFIFVAGEPEHALRALRWQIAEEAIVGRRVGVLLAAEDVDALGPLPEGVRVEVLGRRSQPMEIAGNLFAAMRRLDAQGMDVLLAPQFGTGGIADAVSDRLRRAAGGNSPANPTG